MGRVTITGMLHQDRGRAESFGADAEQYDRARPTYPEQLVSDLLPEPAGIAVLDIGCGTGIASRLFADRGCAVVGVEPDPRMAAVARRSGIDVQVSKFEEWDPVGRLFSLAICAQAWHWLEPGRTLAKLGSMLNPGGRVALFWNKGSHDLEFQVLLDRVYARHAPGLDSYSILLGLPIEDRINAARQSLSASSHFNVHEVVRYPWEKRYTRDEWLDHLPTHSDHRTLPESQRKALLDDIGNLIDASGGTVILHYTTWLLSATLADATLPGAGDGQDVGVRKSP